MISKTNALSVATNLCREITKTTEYKSAKSLWKFVMEMRNVLHIPSNIIGFLGDISKNDDSNKFQEFFIFSASLACFECYDGSM